MATQYCILSAIIRPEIQEKISIGLLFFNDEDVYFSYSKNKLNAAKNLLTKSSFKLLKDILENIECKIEDDNNNYFIRGGFKIFKNKTFDKTFSLSYITYLSRYSNNSIGFSEPKEIGISINSASFKELYRKFIDDFTDKPIIQERAKLIDSIKEKYREKIYNHFDINKEVTHEIVKNLITPVRVDFTGRNEIDVYVQTVDMELSASSVANHINSFVQLKSTYITNKIRVKDFIITKEPDKITYPKQHDIWAQLKQSKFLHNLDFSESEEIIEYAEKHGVVPLSSL